MTQNGPYPGQPWSGGSSDSDEPYTEPADPWGEHGGPPLPPHHEPAWGAHPTSMPPHLDSSLDYVGYGAEPAVGAPPPAWGQPAAPAPPRRNTPIVALVVVLGLLICGGLGTTAWLIANRDNSSGGDQGALPTTSTAATAANPEPRSSEDARFVAKGECVRNEGSPDQPDMKIVPCASGTYQVLKRVDGRTTGEADAESKCSKVPDYTKWYFYDSELDSLDFVLCLRERDS